MASTNGGGHRGRQHEPRRHSRESLRREQADDEDVASLGNDSSTAMSLDESSIRLDAASASAAMTPFSLGTTGASFARNAPTPSRQREGGSGGGRAAGSSSSPPPRHHRPPDFSPMASTSMSISGMDTPMTFSSSNRQEDDARGSAVVEGRGRIQRDAGGDATSKDGTPTNGAGGGTGVIGATARGPSNLRLPGLNGCGDEGSDDAALKNGPRRFASDAYRDEEPDWNAGWDLERVRTRLRRASRECGRRGLKLASRWASEQLMGLAPSPGPLGDARRRYSMEEEDEEEEDPPLPEECCRPNDAELYATSLFDLGEYSRAAHSLSSPSDLPGGPAAASAPPSLDDDVGGTGAPRDDLTSLGVYLRAYSLFLEGERRREERITELRDPLERTSLRNTALSRLEAELRGADCLGRLDAFGLYVYGVVLKELRGTKRAPSFSCSETRCTEECPDVDGKYGGDSSHRVLVRSILLYPFNWSAWLDLGELCVNDPSIDREVEELLLPISGHWMYHFFCVHVFIENKANENAIAIIEKLANGYSTMGEEDADGEIDRGESDAAMSSGFFVQSAYLQSQLAMAYYDVRDYDSAHEHFLALSEREPYRLDHMDAFSNVLYVKDQKAALSHLAHRSVAVDKYRPETCVVVGNYYSSRGRHEKAAQYFQRALKLDRSYLSAWTLLGHEYIEMKNTAAAIEAYRRAVDISDREYRAWYGLGQTYEIMNMLLHALFYFRKAAALHPHDARMWCAIGGCLLGLDRRADAEKSYERAVSLGDGEGIATRKLAELYREDGDEERAARCYLRHLELRYQSQLTGPSSGPSADSSLDAFETVVKNVRVDEPEAEALLYLAYYYRDNLEYDQAALCATRLEDYPGPEKEQGKGLLRDIRSRMDRTAGERINGKPPPMSVPSTPGTVLRSRRGSLSMNSQSGANAESSFEFSP